MVIEIKAASEQRPHEATVTKLINLQSGVLASVNRVVLLEQARQTVDVLLVQALHLLPGRILDSFDFDRFPDFQTR